MTTAAPARSRRSELEIPTTMRAAAIDRFGPASVLKIRTVDVPEPGDHEILIEMHAAGVAIWDAKMRSGELAERKQRFPLVVGSDGAGIVVAKGSRVRRFDVGDFVWAYQYGSPKGGFYADYVAVDADSAGALPDRLDFLEGGAAAATGLTALQGIDDHMRLRRGETVLIFGATGAVGTLAVQFAKRKRAHVLATATGRAASALVKSLGANEVFDVRNRPHLERLEEEGVNGIDAVLALAGGPGLERCLEYVREGGRVVMPNGVEPEPRRRRSFRLIKYDAAAGPSEWERLSRAVNEAKLRVPIAATYPLVQVARAHQRIERGHVAGRIVLRIRRD